LFDLTLLFVRFFVTILQVYEQIHYFINNLLTGIDDFRVIIITRDIKKTKNKKQKTKGKS
jgi:hypothetical protein